SAGFGGITPQGSKCKFDGPTSWMTSLRLAEPVKKLVKPGRFPIEKTEWIRGFRISASTNTTRLPVWVNETAMFIAVTVFPSLGPALVTNTTRGALSGKDKSSDVRTDRYASDMTEDGAACVINSGGVFSSSSLRIGFPDEDLVEV